MDGATPKREKQQEAGRIDAGDRGDVTGGGHMGALELLVKDILIEAEINAADIKTHSPIELLPEDARRPSSQLELPGYYRSTKKWDLVVVSDRQLVMALEFKSIGGSYGNNLNNRAEEAIGNATDIWTAFREGRFGAGPAPFLGYFFLLRDEPRVHTPVKNYEPHFKVDPVFVGASYSKRAEILCQRFVLERLYTTACFVLSTKETQTKITEPAEALTFRRYVAALQGHVAAFLRIQRRS